jgi:predicted dehydrogenase
MCTWSKANSVAPAKLRVGIAGLGFGAGVHLPVFAARPDVEVCALFGRDRVKAEAAATRFDVPIACSSLSEFAALDLDAAIIALPPQLAGEAAAAALRRGWAVLAEKPIALTAAEAEALAAQARGKTAMVDFEFRELPSFRMMKTMLESGRLGRVRSVRISWRSLSYAQRNRVWSWKTDAAQGGGVMTLSGLHLLDLLEWMLGPITPVEAVRSDAATRDFAPRHARPAADTVDLSLTTAAGATIAAHLSNAAPDGHGHRWEIDAEGGQLTLDDGGIGTFGGFALTERVDGRTRVLATDPARQGDYRIGPVSELAGRFLAAARDRVAAAPSFDHAARTHRLLDLVNALLEKALA